MLGPHSQEGALILLSELGLLLEDISVLAVELVHRFLYVLLAEAHIDLPVCCLDIGLYLGVLHNELLVLFRRDSPRHQLPRHEIRDLDEDWIELDPNSLQHG